jgi:integrase
MAYRDKYTIRRGKITLYRRDAEGSNTQTSDIWYAAFKIPGIKTPRRSLHTEYQDEAEAIAEDMYQELLHRHKKGLSFTTKRFSAVANDYLQYFTAQTKLHDSLDDHQKHKLRKFSPTALKNKSPLIKRHLIPFFGDKPINGITQHDIEKYKTARELYWVTGEGSQLPNITYKRGKRTVTRDKLPSEKNILSHNTINKELTIIRDIFDYAKSKNVISKEEIPEISNVPKPNGYDEDHSTPELSEDELRKLLNAIGKKYVYQTNQKHKLAHKRLGMYIAIMASTGLRVSEVKKLTFNDCRIISSNKTEYQAIYVAAKGKTRETIPLRACRKFIEQMRKHHTINAKNFGWEFTDDMPVFMDEKGNHIGSFSKALNSILDEADLLHTKDGRKRNSMSFRPTFITLALSKGEMSTIQLAVNLGTSVEVIERHYNQMKSRHIPEKHQFETTFDRYFPD